MRNICCKIFTIYSVDKKYSMGTSHLRRHINDICTKPLLTPITEFLAKQLFPLNIKEKDYFNNKMTEFIISSHSAFQFVENEEFKKIINFWIDLGSKHPTAKIDPFKSQQAFSRKQVSRKVKNKSKIIKEKIKTQLNKPIKQNKLLVLRIFGLVL